MEENYELVRKLEFARGKIAAVILYRTISFQFYNVFFIQITIHYKGQKAIENLPLNANLWWPINTLFLFLIHYSECYYKN